MRHTFAQILKQEKIDIESEYAKLYILFYGGDDEYGLVEDLEDDFMKCSIRGTCVTLDEFNREFNLNFEENPKDSNIDHLITFCEYIWNMMFSTYSYKFLDDPCSDQISRLIEKLGYMSTKQDGITIYVEKSPEAIAVAESALIPLPMSYKIISYNHHSMRGNLIEKKNVIRQLSDLLEPKRKDLLNVNKDLSNDLFYLFNNLNIRHNNVDPDDRAKYKPVVAEMSASELEQWYDEVYQMCLLAFLSLEHIERKRKFNDLKTRIESK